MPRGFKHVAFDPPLAGFHPGALYAIATDDTLWYWNPPSHGPGISVAGYWKQFPNLPQPRATPPPTRPVTNPCAQGCLGWGFFNEDGHIEKCDHCDHFDFDYDAAEHAATGTKLHVLSTPEGFHYLVDVDHEAETITFIRSEEDLATYKENSR